MPSVAPFVLRQACPEHRSFLRQAQDERCRRAQDERPKNVRGELVEPRTRGYETDSTDERLRNDCRAPAYVIGIDFDNTIVDYDALMYDVALERALIEPAVTKSKWHVRDRIWRRPDGELEWQRVQATVYGPRIDEARAMDGVAVFLRHCASRAVPVYVVSHKTEFASMDETGTNMRESALGWLAHHRFFDEGVAGLSAGAVYFESTRAAKLQRIGQLACTHFIDDLEETFLDPGFPRRVEKLLYEPHRAAPACAGTKVFTSWEAISAYFFGTPR